MGALTKEDLRLIILEHLSQTSLSELAKDLKSIYTIDAEEEFKQIIAEDLSDLADKHGFFSQPIQVDLALALKQIEENPDLTEIFNSYLPGVVMTALMELDELLPGCWYELGKLPGGEWCFGLRQRVDGEIKVWCDSSNQETPLAAISEVTEQVLNQLENDRNEDPIKYQ